MMKNVLKKFFLYSLGIFICLLFAVQIPKINTKITQYIVAQALPTGMYATIKGIEGEFPFNITIHSVDVADEKGQWLAIKNLKFSWIAANLIIGKIDISTLGADQIHVLRFPMLPSSSTTSSSSPTFFLPVNVQSYFVNSLKIAPWFSGQIKIHGDCLLHRLNAIDFSLYLETVGQMDHGEDDLLELKVRLLNNKLKVMAEGSDSLARLETIVPEMIAGVTEGDYEINLEFESNLDGSQAVGTCQGALNNFITSQQKLNHFLGDQLDWNIDLQEHSESAQWEIEADLSTAHNTKVKAQAFYELNKQEYKGNILIDFPELEHLFSKEPTTIAGDLQGVINIKGVVGKDHGVNWNLHGLQFYENDLKEFSGNASYENQKGSFDIKMSYPLLSSHLQGKFEKGQELLRFYDVCLKGDAHNAKGQATFNLVTSQMEQVQAQWAIQNLQPLAGFFHKVAKGSVTGNVQLKDTQLNVKVKGDQLYYEDFNFKDILLTAEGHNLENFRVHLKAAQGHYQQNKIHSGMLKVDCQQGQGIFSHLIKAPQTDWTASGSFAIKDQQWNVLVKNLKLTHQLRPYLMLVKPLHIQGTPAEIMIEANALKMHTGTIHFSTLTFGSVYKGSIKIVDVNLNTFQFLPKGYELAGHIKGDLTFETQNEIPIVKGKFNFKDIHLNNHLRKTRKFFSLDTDFTYQDQQWAGGLHYHDTAASNLKVQGHVYSPRFIPGENAEVSLSAKGMIDLSICNSFIWWGDRVKGKLKLDLNTSHTVSQLHHQGSVHLQNGEYENAEFGTVLRRMDLKASIQGPLIQISHFSGNDFNQGTFSGKGTVHINDLQNIRPQLSVVLNKMLVANNDITSINVSGYIDIKPHQKGALLLEGDIQTNFGDISLGNSVQQIKNVRLVEITEQAQWQLKPRKNVNIVPSSSVYDLTVRIPDNLFIQGQNLKSRWQGNLLVTGPLNMPRIDGQLEATQGQADVIGKQMKLRKGSTIAFETHDGEVEPILDIHVEKTIRDVVTTIWIHGEASDPKIEFISIPALSQEEVVSLLLFGKPLNSVSAAQSLQLATRIAAIKTGEKGSNIMDQFQQAFGLDEFSVGASEAAEEGDDRQSSISKGYAVKVGKQLNEKIYFGVEQGLGGETGTKAIVNVDVTKNTKVNLEAGATDRSVGYMWEKRY